MVSLPTPTEQWRIQPAYSFSQAARLAKTSSTNVRRWLRGYEQPGRRMKPVFSAQAGSDEPTVSFLQLVEIIIVTIFRKERHITLERIRRAHRFASEKFHLDYPFATLRMKTNGRDVLMDFERENPGRSLLALSGDGQFVLPLGVAEAVETFEFDTWAVRWFPVGKDVPIVIDPQRGAAKPTVEDRGITIDTLYRRWKNGQTYRFISKEYRLPLDVVEKALRFADQVVDKRLAA